MITFADNVYLSVAVLPVTNEQPLLRSVLPDRFVSDSISRLYPIATNEFASVIQVPPQFCGTEIPADDL